MDEAEKALGSKRLRAPSPNSHQKKRSEAMAKIASASTFGRRLSKAGGRNG